MLLRIGWYAAVVTATVVFLVMLWQFGAAIILFFLSLAIAAALKPIVHSASSGRLSRLAGLTIIYILLIGSIVAGWLALGPPLFRDLQQATNDFLMGYEQAITDWPTHGTPFQKMLAAQLPPSDEFYNSLTTEEGINALEGVFGIAGSVVSLLSFLLISIVLSIYWSADQFRFERIGLSLMPAEQHPRALSAWRAAETGVGGYLRSETIQSLVALIVLAIAYTALDLKYPVLLALWVAIARLVPWFGVLIALAPGLLIWMGISPASGFIYTIATLSVLILIRRSIRPHLFQMPEYNSLPTLLLIIALAEGFGFIGILVAPLLGLTLRILLQEFAPATQNGFSEEVIRKITRILMRLSALRTRLDKSQSVEAGILLSRVQNLARQTRDYLR